MAYVNYVVGFERPATSHPSIVGRAASIAQRKLIARHARFLLCCVAHLTATSRVCCYRRDFWYENLLAMASTFLAKPSSTADD